MCLAKLPYGKYFLLFLGLAPLLSSTLTTYPWHCLLPGTIGRSNLILAYALGLLSFRELPVLGEKAGVAMGIKRMQPPEVETEFSFRTEECWVGDPGHV